MSAVRFPAPRIAASLVASQGASFACMLAAARGEPVFGVAAAALAIALHFAMSRERARDALLVSAAVVVGLVWDSALAGTGTVLYASPGPLPQWAPAWILAMWALFGTTLREPLRWLHGRPALGALMGGAGGAIAYASAERLGACRFPDAGSAILVIAIGWALLAPMLIDVARRLDAESAPVGAAP